MQGRPTPDDPWGKFRDEGRGGPAWHPLDAHCTDVACVMEALLAQPTIRRRLARAGGLDDLDEVQRARLCWLAFMHDLGKCCRGFRAKASVEPRQTCGHIAALRPLLWGDLGGRLLEALGAGRLAAWGPALDQLFLATIAHHGAPVEQGFKDPEDLPLRRAWDAVPGDDPFGHLAELVVAGQKLFGQAFDGGPSLSNGTTFQHVFAGLLMLADWLGSGDGRDMFPYAAEGDPPRAGFARRQAREVLAAIGLDPAGIRARLGNAPPAFADQFGFPPNELQYQIDLLPLPDPGGVVLIESETGSGKTEAALRWATRLFAAGTVDGIFFALPLRSAAVQLHGRVQRWLDRTFGAGAVEALLAVPGYVRAGDAEGRRLPDFSVQWSDGLPEDRRLARWAAEEPKRFLAAPFAVGTVDQALLGVLQVKHAHLRSACLVRNLLVVDEVHSSDPYMRCLLGRLLELFRAAGGQVALMSATLGEAARAELLGGTRARPRPLAAAREVPYPLISPGPGAPVSVRTLGRAKEVAVELLPAIDAPGAVAAEVTAAVAQGAKVLVLRNTVGAAVETALAVEAALGEGHPALFRVGEVATLHHGRFAAEDRRLLDGAVERRFGKGSGGGPAVVVATQTVEQSLDVDFDLLLTDLCPVDVLLQRIGRLWRHDRARPPGCDTARCVVLEPERSDLGPYLAVGRHGFGFGRDGKGRAYPDLRTVEATRRLIGGGARWCIPADNRRLVEEGTHPERLATVAASLGGAWVAHGQKFDGTRLAQTLQALDNAIAFREPFGKLQYPDPAKIKILTRLGGNDLLLPLDRPLTSPFGERLERLRLPGWMVRPETWAALAGVDEPVIVAEGDTLVLHGQKLAYGRLGLQHAE